MVLPLAHRVPARPATTQAARLSRRALFGLVAAGATLLAACGRGGGAGASSDGSGSPDPAVLRYGPDPSQYAELSLPADGPGPWPVVVVLHGGFWGAGYGLELGRTLAADLAANGVAALNVEYRRLDAGGGYPATFDDVAAAIDMLADAGQQAAGGRLDRRRVVTLGHSAGGTLAVWAVSRARMVLQNPSAAPRVPVRAAVSQAGVLDLATAAAQGLGGDAVTSLLGGTPEAVPAAYADASPIALLPATGDVVAVHGTADTTVPIDQSERYVAAAAGVPSPHRARLVRIDGAHHLDLIDTANPAWATTRTETLALVKALP